MKNPLVSVIIPTKNSELYLSKVLKSVVTQTYSNIEIIVIDNNSKDETKEISQKFTNKVYNKGPERSVQKNYGVLKSSGKYLLFLDSDAVLTKNVVLECVELCENGNSAVIIPERHIGFGFWSKVKALERKCYLGSDNIEAPWFYNKPVFNKIGKYNEDQFAGEDWDLFDRLRQNGYSYDRNKSFINHQIGHLNFFKFISKKYYYGKNLGKYVLKSKRRNVSILKKIPLFRVEFFKNWRLLVCHPILTCGIIFLKIGESFFLYLGMRNNKLKK